MTQSGTSLLDPSQQQHQQQQQQQHALLPRRTLHPTPTHPTHQTRTHFVDTRDAMTNKKSHKVLLQLHHKPIRNQQQEDPWLFQRLTLPPSALFSPAHNGRPFHLDVESLRSLLPSNGPNSSFPHDRHHLHARLEAIVHAPPASQRTRLRTKSRRKRMPRFLESSNKRKRLAASANANANVVAGAGAGAGVGAGGVGTAVSGSHEHGRRPSLFLRELDDNDQVALPSTGPPTTVEDVDEKQRQKKQIAAQLDLTLEEFEAFDASFGLSGSSSCKNGSGDKAGDRNDAAADSSTTTTTRYRELFQKFDVDGSGAISPEELRQVLSAAGERDMDDAELAEIIEQADTDKDGQIDFEEFINLMRARRRKVQLARNMRASVCGVAQSESKSAKSNKNHGGSSSIKTKATSHQNANLPPLRLASLQSKKHMKLFNRHFSRPTPTCLRPGVQVNLVQLRRELAISEYGIQELNSKVREGLQWVQQNCPVSSIKAQLFCHRWGIEKLQQLFLRIQFHALSAAFYKWNDFRLYQSNKQKATLYLRCKGSQKMNEIMTKWKRKVCRRKLNIWVTECTNEARSEVHSAATEIQRIIRGVLTRRRRFHQRQQQAATTIQALVRGRQARQRVHQMRQCIRENHAASVLQRCYRGYNGKRLAKALFRAQRETLAARKIQRAFRSHQKKALLSVIQRTKLENDSAITIQCAIRRALARTEYNKRLTVKKRQHAVVVIQSHIRRHLACRKVHKLKQQHRAATTIQTRFRGFICRKQVAQMKQVKHSQQLKAKLRASAITIQRYYRGFSARTEYTTQRHQIVQDRKLRQFRRFTGAVRIQSIFRGFRARRKAQRLRVQKLQHETVHVMDCAAVRIQSCWRGHRARLAARLRKRARQALKEEQQKAVVRIQSLARGKLTRNELDRRQKRQQKQQEMALRRQQLRVKAAMQIQRVFRGTQARKLANEIKKKHAEEARKALDRLMKQTRERAAIQIQSCCRRFVARVHYTRRKQALERNKKLQLQRLQEDKACVVIQCAIRRRRARKLLQQRRHDFERRISMMASEKAHDEIERLRLEQEQELQQLKLQLLFEKEQAAKEAQKLKEELETRRAREQAQREQEETELAQLKLQTLLQKTQLTTTSSKLDQGDPQAAAAAAAAEAALLLVQQQAKAQEEQQQQQLMQLEQTRRNEENAELLKRKMERILQQDKLQQLNRQESAKELQRLQQETNAMQKTQQQVKEQTARLQIQKFLMQIVVHKRLQRLQQQQQVEMNLLQDEHDKLRVKAEQEKAKALLKMQAMFDNEARAREQEVKQLEAQVLEKALQEQAKLHQRNMAARKIQSVLRGYCGRQRVKKMQESIAKERQQRAKTLEQSLAAIEAEAEAAVKAAAAAAAASVGPSTTTTTSDEWVEYWDENAQASYYYNIRTQEASWTRPMSATKAMDLMRTATSALPSTTVDFQQDNYAPYMATTTLRGTNATGSSQSYADEYGFYDQYGQYHYYDESQASRANPNANAMAMGGGAMVGGAGAMGVNMNPAMYSAAMGMYNPFMPAMAYNPMAAQQLMLSSQIAAASMMNPMMMNQMMMQQQQQQQQQQQTQVQAQVTAPTVMAAADGAAPGEPWTQYYDEYSGSSYYYNNVTGEKYWA